MAITPNKTLGDLTTKLAIRLGRSAMGTPGSTQQSILEEFLQDAQDQLAEQFEDIFLHVINTDEPGATQAGDTLYDIPDDADPYRLTMVAAKIGQQWTPLNEGITIAHRSTTQTGYPARYMLRYGTTDQGQIEIWPEPGEAYALLLEYTRKVQPFTELEHKSTVPWRLVFLHALANAKGHFGHKDADIIGNQLTAMLRKLRMRQHRGKRYFKQGFKVCDHPLFGPRAHEWIEQAGKTIVDIDVLLSETGEYLRPE